jgi:pimeloyl-ACP methyl ester carboxylesterase
VNVGGHELQYRCSGKGAPVVVMDAGLGGTMATWNEVTPGIEAFTRVCSYDRAGLGRSGPGPMPRTSAQIVKELHALLVNAGIPPPYILVGHSLGGLNVRLYAGEYPGEVAGLVLVDATHEDYPARERELRPEQERKRIEASFASAGAAARSEYESLAASVAEVRAAPPLPDVPLTVITAGNHAESRVLNEVWMTLQGDLVRLAPRGRQVIAPESGHYVQFDQPAIIVSAVRDMVRELRPASPGPAAR